MDFEEGGNAGVEKALDDDLKGEAGQMRLLTDVKRRGIDSQLDTEAHPGVPLALTIDERIQFVAEHELAAAVEAHHAVSGSVVVMMPTTGDVLALASYPTYDPNEQANASQNFARQNHAGIEDTCTLAAPAHHLCVFASSRFTFGRSRAA